MAESLNALLENFDLNGPSVIGIIEGVEKHFGCVLPDEYKHFMGAHDGGEGFFGKQYVILWRTAELIDFNRDYEVTRYAPGLLLFGSSGGGEAFAFDIREEERMRVRMVPFIGMSLKDAKPIADTFKGFLIRLAKSDETLP
jgi:SMI1 / KNR4 family (SUKH-1)